MLARSVALAIVGSATAFSPMMSMETGRRQIVQAGAAAPLLRATPASAGKKGLYDANAGMDKSGRAPLIVVFDHRGCNRGGTNAEYQGKQAGDQDDEMCVKVCIL